MVYKKSLAVCQDYVFAISINKTKDETDFLYNKRPDFY